MDAFLERFKAAALVIAFSPLSAVGSNELVYTTPDGGVTFKRFKTSRVVDSISNVFHINERLLSPSEEFNVAVDTAGTLRTYRNPGKTRNHSGAEEVWHTQPLGVYGGNAYVQLLKGCRLQIVWNDRWKDLFPGGGSLSGADCYISVNDSGTIELRKGDDYEVQGRVVWNNGYPPPQITYPIKNPGGGGTTPLNPSCVGIRKELTATKLTAWFTNNCGACAVVTWTPLGADGYNVPDRSTRLQAGDANVEVSFSFSTTGNKDVLVRNVSRCQ